MIEDEIGYITCLEEYDPLTGVDARDAIFKMSLHDTIYVQHWRMIEIWKDDSLVDVKIEKVGHSNRTEPPKQDTHYIIVFTSKPQEAEQIAKMYMGWNA